MLIHDFITSWLDYCNSVHWRVLEDNPKTTTGSKYDSPNEYQWLVSGLLVLATLGDTVFPSLFRFLVNLLTIQA